MVGWKWRNFHRYLIKEENASIINEKWGDQGINTNLGR